MTQDLKSYFAHGDKNDKINNETENFVDIFEELEPIKGKNYQFLF